MRQSIFSYKNNVNEYFYTEHRNAAKMITTITYCRNVIAGLCTNSSYTQKANNHPYWRTHTRRRHTQTTHANTNKYILIFTIVPYLYFYNSFRTEQNRETPWTLQEYGNQEERSLSLLLTRFFYDNNRYSV